MALEKIWLKFDELIIEVEADKQVCNNLKFIYRNYVVENTDAVKIYFKIDGSAEAILTNRDIAHICYSYNGIDYLKWEHSDTIFPPLLLEPLKGRYIVLHGCCVSKAGKAYAILGRSMSGKTRIMLHLINSGYKLLSDDIIFVDKNNYILAYKKPFGFRTLISDEFPELYKKIIRHKEKIVFESKQGFRTYLVHADDLFSGIYDEEKVPLSQIFIISGDQDGQLTSINMLNRINDLRGLCCNSGIEPPELVSRLISLVNQIDLVKCTPDEAQFILLQS